MTELDYVIQDLELVDDMLKHFKIIEAHDKICSIRLKLINLKYYYGNFEAKK